MLRKLLALIRRRSCSMNFCSVQDKSRWTRLPEIHGTTIEEQAEQVMKNVGAVLAEAGTDFEAVIKTTCFLSDMGDFAAFNEVYGRYFTEKPARSCVAVKALPKNVLCEVEVIAAVGK